MLDHLARPCRLLIALAVCGLSPAFARADDNAGRLPKPDFDYICWDAHRYSQTLEDAVRDARYLKDLGFTHSFFGRILQPGFHGHKKDAIFVKAFNEVGLLGGIKPTLDRRGSRVAMITGVEKPKLMEMGAVLTRKDGSGGGMNVIHPFILEKYPRYFADYTAQLAKDDPRGVLRLFLMGTEIHWYLPEKEAYEYNRVGVQAILDAAAADAVVAKGAPYDPDDPELQYWWNGPYQKGKCWRLRKATEDAILKVVPDADFMVDPLYAVKIVNGFGGTWIYIDNDPKRIGAAVGPLKAMCWPAPACVSTQLIRGGWHDCVMEANLLALCMGVDKLYHWGVHLFEPGANADYQLRREANKVAENKQLTGKAKNEFVQAYVNDPARRKEIEDALLRKRTFCEPAIRSTGRLLRYRGALLRDMKPAGPRVAVVGLDYAHRLGNGPGLILMASNIPYECLYRREHVRKHLKDYSHAILARGYLFPDVVEAIQAFEQAGGKIIVIDTDAKDVRPVPKLSSPIMWTPFGRDERISGAHVEGMGGFKLKISRLDSQEADALLQAKGKVIRELLADSGFKAYVDSLGPALVVRTYEHKGTKLLFAVNDRRVVSEDNRRAEAEDAEDGDGGGGPRKRQVAAKGVANEVHLVIHDPRPDLRAINIDTGEPVKMTREKDGWHVRDTIEPAWYRLYAILGEGETWQGHGPLPAGPGIRDLSAERKAGGVHLSWKLPFDDWVGCDVQWYRLYRAAPGGKPDLLAEVYARELQGPGGLVTSYADTTAKPDGAYRYQVQAVTPLRRPGPLSEAAAVGPTPSPAKPTE